jgi:hypothetical protein
MLRRDDGDRSEIVTFSLWDSTTASERLPATILIKQFSIRRRRFLIERDLKVRHYEVVA